MTPDEFGAFIKADIVRWTAIAKARNINLDS
jgi:tripartite-type tricarboxylate transporter receptor subunit TctC